MITDKEQQQWNEAMQGVYEWEQEIIEHNHSVLRSLGVTDFTDFYEMSDGSKITDKIEIVDNPEGKPNHEDFGIFTDIHVDQYSVGDSGDSYAGYIYGQFAPNKWIKVPYEC